MRRANSNDSSTPKIARTDTNDASNTSRATTSRLRSRDAALRALPGLALALIVAGAATVVAEALPGPVSAVPLAVVFGVLIASHAGPRFAPGVAVATKRVLQFGIILLGARLSLVEVAELGLVSVGLVVISLAIGLASAWHVGKRFGLTAELALLLGVGSAVCGNTAILATAPIIRARSRDVGLAVATITLCGTVSLLVYPVVGRLIGLDDAGFGMWVGLAVQDTSQVVATGAAFSESARDVATVVKLVRNSSLGVLLPLLAWMWSRRNAGLGASSVGVRKTFPMFVLWFLCLAAARSVGIFDEGLGDQLGDMASHAILIAVAGLGLSVKFADLRRASVRPIVVGIIAAATLGAFGLASALIVGEHVG